MPTPVLLRYALRSQIGHYYFVDGSGNVQLSPTVRYLEHSPVDWEKTEFQMGRDGRHWGVFRKVILPVTFAKDGARIIRHIAFTMSIDAYCRYEIYRRNDTDYLYSLVSEGEIDFTEIVNDDHTVSVKAVENGLQALIEAESGKIVEIDLDADPDVKTMSMDGVALQAKYNWILPATLDSAGNPTSISHIGFINGYTQRLDVAYLNEETYVNLGTGNSHFYIDTAGDVFESSYDFSATFMLSALVRVTVMDTAMNVVFTFALEEVDASNAVVNSYSLHTHTVTANGSAQVVDIPVSATQALGVTYGQRFRLSVNIAVSGSAFNSGDVKWQVVGDGSLGMTSVFTMPETAAKGLRFIDLFKKVISSLSGGLYSAASTYLSSPTRVDFSNKPFNTFVTCGAALRRLPGAKLKTTLADLLQTAKAVWGLTLGVEGTVARLEQPAHFLNPSLTIFHAANIDKYRAMVAKEHRYNLINVGYPDQDYDEINGRQEVNSEQQWTTGIKNTASTLDLVSKYRADAFGIEYVRSRQFIEAGTSSQSKYATEQTDDSSDDDVFLVHMNGIPVQVNGQNVYTLYRGWVAVSGFVVANATMFNLTLTPHRNLCRSLPLIKAGLDTTAQLRFVSGKKNTAVQVTDMEVITESADQSLAAASAAFRYLIYEIELPVPHDLLDLMSGANKYGRISFKDDRGNVLTGFPLDIIANPATRNAKKVRLLAAPGEDLAKQSFVS